MLSQRASLIIALMVTVITASSPKALAQLIERPKTPRASDSSPSVNEAGHLDELTRIARAVGRITQTDAQGRSLSATCFWITSTRLVTNWHAVHNNNEALIEMGADSEITSTHRMVRVIGVDEAGDIAVIEAAPPFDGPTLTLADALPERGEEVTILTMRLVFDRYMTGGTVERTDQLAYMGPNLSIFSPQPPVRGWSGSPILDREHRVVGVIRLNGPVRSNAAPVTVIHPLLELEGVPANEWSPEPQTPCGHSAALVTRAQLIPLDQRARRMALYRKAAEQCPDNFTAWTRIGRIAIADNDVETALEAFERAAALSPDAPHGLALASIYDRLGRPDDAAAERVRTEKRDPSGFRFFRDLDRAMQLAARGQYDLALPGLKRAVEGAPDHTGARIVYAQALILTAEPARAIPHIERVLTVEPASRRAHVLRGLALSTIEDWPRLLNAARQYLIVEPEAPLGRAYLAEALIHTGRSREAREVLEQLELDDPNLAALTRQRIQRLQER